MPLVIDSSIAVAWVIADEDSELARYALASAYSDGMIAPRIFWYEFRNTLIVNERHGRLVHSEIEQALAVMEALQPIFFHDHDDSEVMRLSRTHKLSAYDAAYLELALRKRQLLATLDRKLEVAAIRESVAVRLL